MTGFSIDTVWEEMTAFLRREHALLLPLALATFGLALLLLGIAADAPRPADGAMPQPGLRALWVIPALVLTTLGNIAVSVVVLRPGQTLADSLRLAITRLPAAMGILGLGMLAMFALIIVLTIVALGVGMGTVGKGMDALVAIIVVPAIWVSVRMLVLWPAVADSGRGPIPSIKLAFAMTRGQALKSLGVTVIFALVYVTLVSIAQLVLASLFGLIGLAVGQAALMKLIVSIAVAFIGAVLMMGWTVYLALAYRKLKA
ncbi:hypothetical protein [Sphingomonas montanisoli]|uniref:Glycerophosphoryl diester phosphodiesterase membrane domain-containing protein n=1 Tax=Sphingomonas montanisoli TaxID=2606412 RepID=A0A5D9CBR7_9SPHN|nr:hypothetical protein [Sphingomonas montanisoli]TZG27561.1 hypothetical protein FYJ91_08215 [Sphingomonas montanisoli]